MIQPTDAALLIALLSGGLLLGTVGRWLDFLVSYIKGD